MSLNKSRMPSNEPGAFPRGGLAPSHYGKAPNKIKVGIFADDLDLKTKGAAVVLRNLLEQYIIFFNHEIDLRLIHKKNKCRHRLCGLAQTIPIKILPLPRFAGFFSYFFFFLFTRERFDIIHFPRPMLHPAFWLLKLLKKTRKIVVTFHGAPENSDIPIYQTFINHFNLWFIKFFGVYFIDSAIVDSKTAVEQVAHYYKIQKNKIAFIYNGVKSEFKPFTDGKAAKAAENKIKMKYQIPFPYILTVSRLDPHKNLHRLIEAFYYLKIKRQTSHYLVIVGGRHDPNYSGFLATMIKKLKLDQWVYIAPFIEDEDLRSIYSLADFFIFVSLSEGFGLPLIEAMACGAPVITSSISSMPEITGGAALTADPYNVKEITNAMENLLSDTQLKERLIEKGLKRASNFSWNKTAGETIQLYKKILQKEQLA